MSWLYRDEELHVGVGIHDVEVSELVPDPISWLVRICRAGERPRQLKNSIV